MKANPGKKSWYIPDAYLPSSGLGEKWEGHESVCVLNVGEQDAILTFILYFEDREPITIRDLRLAARSNRHIGMHKPEQLCGVEVPRDVPYGIAVESDQPIIVQYSRLDVTQPNFSLMTTTPYSE
ncbi:sensory rhodopsin transducer [Rubellicoccus peritrichatus]|uniref:Sensory rhodopsin transducer n=1 Tax=Rubellicoccus peritrichatus TaxID=3080537 RepID=A0AAQ3LCJ3_9BACT|nr:sensory rhodopsin transducer [Puniceicoccus sp. CR14]WOO43296.1 sensory rhodopsin transducer [Puniceicoccus sp. CR14]